jgi:hypothetical protein
MNDRAMRRFLVLADPTLEQNFAVIQSFGNLSRSLCRYSKRFVLRFPDNRRNHFKSRDPNKCCTIEGPRDAPKVEQPKGKNDANEEREIASPGTNYPMATNGLTGFEMTPGIRPELQDLKAAQALP